MKVIGRVEGLWRYPVKSMRGEELEEAFAGFSGVYGDRLYAFRSSAAPEGFPYFTGREQETMILYGAAYRDAQGATKPPNLAAAEALAPGMTPICADPSDLDVEVTTPSGEVLAIDDAALIGKLREHARDAHQLTLVRSDRSMTDCRPISLFSTATAQQLGRELGTDVDKRRFRANVYVDLESGKAFEEDELVGRMLRIGAKAVVAITDRDPRCKIITLDPDTAEANPEIIMRLVAGSRDGKAGIYGAVMVEGAIRRDDEIVLLD